MARFIKNTNYHTLAGLENELTDALGGAAEAELIEIGLSSEGRPIKAVCFGSGDFRKPEVLFFGVTHAIELIGAEASLSIARSISGGAHSGVLEKINVWIVPVLNPDGYSAVERRLTTGLGIGYGRANARGVDLNRNFPVAFYHIPTSVFAGSPFKTSAYYRGEAPCSESESSAFRDFVLGRNFKTAMAFHSFGSTIMFPYSHTSSKTADHDRFETIGAEMVALQSKPYKVLAGYKHYSTNGSINDWMYDECGILAFLMEIGKLGVAPDKPETWLNPFYWYNPIDPRNEIEGNVLPACMRLIGKTAEEYGGEPPAAGCS